MTNFLLALQMSPHFSKNLTLKNNTAELHNILMKLYHKCGNNNVVVSNYRSCILLIFIQKEIFCSQSPNHCFQFNAMNIRKWCIILTNIIS